MKDIECEVMKCGPQVPELRIGEIPPDDQVSSRRTGGWQTC